MMLTIEVYRKNTLTVTIPIILTEIVSVTATVKSTSIDSTVTCSEGFPCPTMKLKPRQQLNVTNTDPVIRDSGDGDLTLACQCLKVPDPVSTVNVEKTQTEMLVQTSILSIEGPTTTLSVPYTTTQTKMVFVKSTKTITTTVTTRTEVVAATQTNILPIQCFTKETVSWEVADTGRISNQIDHGAVSYEECCYRCWNTTDCLYFSFENGPENCYNYIGKDTDISYYRFSNSCPLGINEAGVMLYSSQEEFLHLGPCMYQSEPCTACNPSPP